MHTRKLADLIDRPDTLAALCRATGEAILLEDAGLLVLAAPPARARERIDASVTRAGHREGTHRRTSTARGGDGTDANPWSFLRG